MSNQITLLKEEILAEGLEILLEQNIMPLIVKVLEEGNLTPDVLGKMQGLYTASKENPKKYVINLDLFASCDENNKLYDLKAVVENGVTKDVEEVTSYYIMGDTPPFIKYVDGTSEILWNLYELEKENKR